MSPANTCGAGPDGGDPPARGDAPVSRDVRICNERGLHARAAAKFVRKVSEFDAHVEVTRNDVTVSGQSIMGLMMLAAANGCTIKLTATGNDARAALDGLQDLIERQFDES